jgi:diadenosine tetraphosphate (Ap4A) HIT family hydrolase
MMKARKRKFVGRAAMVRFLLAILAALSFSIQAEEFVDATAQYDPDNIFARILRGDAPADVVFENDYALAFHDIRPRAKVHVLVIPKGPYTNVMQFNARASDEEKLGLLDAISQTAQIMKVDETGFRLISYTGGHGKQTVPHLHVHILGGEPVHIGTR